MTLSHKKMVLYLVLIDMKTPSEAVYIFFVQDLYHSIGSIFLCNNQKKNKIFVGLLKFSYATIKGKIRYLWVY